MIETVSSPVGILTLTATDEALTGVWFDSSKDGRVKKEGPAGTNPVLKRTREQLEEYFAGTRTEFDLPLQFSGTTFQQRVWNLLRTIPFGITTSYGELARRLGDPKATRAVGAANGQNPSPIIVPCHRVVGSRGELTGFGGGIERKRWLLEHEGALLPLKS